MRSTYLLTFADSTSVKYKWMSYHKGLSFKMPKFDFALFSFRLPSVHWLCDCLPGAEIQFADSDLVLFSGHHPSDSHRARPRRLCCGYCLWQMYCQPYAQGEGGYNNLFGFSCLAAPDLMCKYGSSGFVLASLDTEWGGICQILQLKFRWFKIMHAA